MYNPNLQIQFVYSLLPSCLMRSKTDIFSWIGLDLRQRVYAPLHSIHGHLQSTSWSLGPNYYLQDSNWRHVWRNHLAFWSFLLVNHELNHLHKTKQKIYLNTLVYAIKDKSTSQKVDYLLVRGNNFYFFYRNIKQKQKQQQFKSRYILLLFQ